MKLHITQNYSFFFSRRRYKMCFQYCVLLLRVIKSLESIMENVLPNQIQHFNGYDHNNK